MSTVEERIEYSKAEYQRLEQYLHTLHRGLESPQYCDQVDRGRHYCTSHRWQPQPTIPGFTGPAGDSVNARASSASLKPTRRCGSVRSKGYGVAQRAWQPPAGGIVTPAGRSRTPSSSGSDDWRNCVTADAPSPSHDPLNFIAEVASIAGMSCSLDPMCSSLTRVWGHGGAVPAPATLVGHRAATQHPRCPFASLHRQRCDGPWHRFVVATPEEKYMEVAGDVSARSPSVAMRDVRPARVTGGQDLHRHSFRHADYEGSQHGRRFSCVHILRVRGTHGDGQVAGAQWHEEANILSASVYHKESSTHDRRPGDHYNHGVAATAGVRPTIRIVGNLLGG